MDRSKFNKELGRRTEQSYQHKDDSGQFRSIFKQEYIEKIWKCKAASHEIDIIPYLAGPDDPAITHGLIKEGEAQYLLDIWVHRDVGVNRDMYVCPARNYNLPCPICEERDKIRRQDDYDEELVKSLSPKRRSIYNIVVYDDGQEQAKGVQIFDVAHFFMEQKLAVLAKRSTGRSGANIGGYIPFSDPDEGKTVSFERKGQGAQNTEFLGHKFLDREIDGKKYVISDEILSQAIVLDQAIEIPTYEELESAFKGTAPIEVIKEEDVPLRLSGRMSRTTKVAESIPNSDNPCPAGGNFGVDCEMLPKCPSCAVWDNCFKKASEDVKVIVKDVKTPAVNTDVPPPRAGIRRRR